MPVITIQDDAHFQSTLTSANTKLVIVDFTAKWCGPCRMVAPDYERLSDKYLHVVFTKVDVDDCDSVAHKYNITSVPTFIFFRAKTKLAELKGAMGPKIEEKILELAGTGADADASGSGSSGGSYAPHTDLTPLISKSGCECLNEADEYPLANALESHKGTYLESDCDEQLIITLAFSQPIKLHSLKIRANKEYGPKTLKLFINQPKTLDFDRADSTEPVQVLEFTPDDLHDAKPVAVKYVKFQNVNNLTIFVKDNQGNKETTRITQIVPIGSAVAATNMNEFKRVGGKQGEAH